MRLPLKRTHGQLSRCSVFFLVFICFLFFSCKAAKEEAPVNPPETSLLSRNYIGYGVITDSFTHICLDPSEQSESLGYLRRGTLVKVIRRQALKIADGYVSWVLIDTEPQGWLKEDVLDIYDNESQAKTASELAFK